MVRTEENDVCLSESELFKYRSALEMVLFLVNYSRSDIASAVQELSKVNNRENHTHYKQMLQVVKYVLLTRNRMLKFIPEKWEKNGS